jgi:cytochrome c553
MLRSQAMSAITRDKFALAVEADGQSVDVGAVTAALREAGAYSIEVVSETEAPILLSPQFLFRTVGAIGLACLVAGIATYTGVKLFPVSIPMQYMLNQPRLDPQQLSSYFKDGFGMRLPVAGTVARGHIPYAIKDPDHANLVNPLPRTNSVIMNGKQNFTTYCSVCHGVLGDGTPSLTAAYQAKPANLNAQTFREYADGRIYQAVVMGKNAMKPYAADLTPDERWAVVHYVRVLQRAYDAKDEDLPKENPQ